MSTHDNLIQLAKTEKFLNQFSDNQGRIPDEKVLEFIFLWSDKLTVYKIEKDSGYNNYLLYNGVLIYVCNSSSEMSNKISHIPVVDDWISYPTDVLKRIVLNKMFENPFTRSSTYKKSAEKAWEVIYNTFI